MTNFNVGAEFAFDPKAIMAGNAACGLWVRAGSWCAEHTDGALPAHMVRTLGGQKRDAEKLVEVGLWRPTVTGYEFVTWLRHNRSKEQVSAQRDAGRDRVARHRASKRNAVTDAVTPPVTNAVSNGGAEQSGAERSIEATTKTSRIAARAAPMPAGFAEFWDAYPRHTDKAAAVKAWPRAVKATDPFTIVSGAQRYRDDPNRLDEFTKHASTWLNAGSWDNDPEPPRGGVKLPTVTDKLAAGNALIQRLQDRDAHRREA